MSLTKHFLQQALALPPGHELFVPADSYRSQKELFVSFRKELRNMREYSPVDATQLQIDKVIRSHKYWIVIRKMTTNPFEGWIKTPNGEVKPVESQNPERLRRFQLMLNDGWTVAELIKEEGLTDSEVLCLNIKGSK